MSFKDHFRVKAGKKVDLSAIDPEGNPDISKAEAKEKTAQNLKRIRELQKMLSSEHEHALWIVMQAMDTGGKDGIIEVLTSGMNAQGVNVTSYKKPSERERLQDYIWRVHMNAPARGFIGISNRSHYEEVLVVRVNNFVNEKKWRKRYGHINDFERMLADNDTSIAKFFLHISKDEQLQRLKDRMDDPSKNWKLSPDDFTERAKWDKYQEAYEDALSKCSKKRAPWYIIPANKKWYRDYVVTTIVVEHLEALKMKYPDPVVDLAETRKIYEAEVAKMAEKPKAKAPKNGK